MHINDSIRASYYKKVFEAVDGLWFMKIEEATNFDRALDIDRRVWEVVPKIQARALRSLLGLKGHGLEILQEALTAKFQLEEHEVEFQMEGEELLVKVKKCPWYGLMRRSGREHLAARVGETICGTEYPIWMREFGVNGEFKLESLLCGGASCCVMRFRISDKHLVL